MSDEIKKLSAEMYEGFIGEIIGDSLHPGGLEFTAQIAKIAKINKEAKVLDIACGKGASANHIAENFECDVVGMDLSTNLIKLSKRFLNNEASIERAQFTVGDAEFMPFIDSHFDVVMCECALNLFPNKRKVLSEAYRVLKSEGRLLVADIVLRRELPAELKTKLTFALCVAGAETLEKLHELVVQTGFVDIHVEDHSEKLVALGLKLLLDNSSSEDSVLSFSNTKFLERLCCEDMLSYALMIAHKP